MKLSTDQFSYNPQTKVFCAEVSDFKGQWFSRLYIDVACDEGIWLKSHKTGKTIRFYLACINKDNEGETLSWTLFPVPQDVQGNYSAAACSIELFND